MPAESQTELEALLEMRGYQRDSLVGKLDGLTEEQARSTPTVSSMSLLSIVKHSAIWERVWFQYVAAGRSFPDQWPETGETFDNENPTFVLDYTDTIESVVADYRRQAEASNAVLAELDLDGRCSRTDWTDESVRWVALHMIEETSRHAGHADIIRETIDGSTGR